jgi:diadenosine tetraphosphate (Ap4A) HIT family hydrolase
MCIFCEKQGEDILFENESAKAFFDQFPVNKGHILIVPKEHKESYFDLDYDEITDINALIDECRDLLEEHYKAEGFNIGWNCGEVAGQTIFHAHCHLIPRYKGDVEKPKGGIRNFKESIVPY